MSTTGPQKCDAIDGSIEVGVKQAKRDPKQQVILNEFVMNTPGHLSVGLWAHPSDSADKYSTLKFWIHLAQLLDKAKFRAMLIADTFGASDVYKGPFKVQTLISFCRAIPCQQHALFDSCDGRCHGGPYVWRDGKYNLQCTLRLGQEVLERGSSEQRPRCMKHRDVVSRQRSAKPWTQSAGSSR
ncbi:hypothetical protein PV08_09567 [Exophiala spinifera]|uniref:Uncharacterized protein n=1 Tax=Exophiala spinifera TaxID=91928 RepID=A0A0D2B0Q7_9EURO|nr:uncharacterized protein PV08_09567 [Exophiala spinifera]KIW12290.1 hypothetical protein PV08_09567 [Exophiala spinifera]